MRIRPFLLGNVLLVALLSSVDVSAAFRRGPESFLDSDDYRDGEEIVGVFLGDEEYARMVEGVEYRGIEFDWTWYRANYRKPTRPTRLEFRVADYGTVRVLPVINRAPALAPGIEEEVRELFVQAMGRLGLEVVGEGEAAALELGVAIVDYKADSTYIFIANIDPFIELEVRLRDTDTGEPLVLIRNQDHNSTPVLGAGDTAAGLMRVLQ